MSLTLILACLWVLAATGVAVLPMRHQYAPGVGLLILAPVLIGVIWYENGIWLALVAVFGFVSMFRRPLLYFWRKARGETSETPE
ncbi:hypothetical protein NBRC116590_05500 [Pelagimonas sp. KU-00592-HH]|uniref:DUF2484 family protein n=1 Tax=Pelagimonas sp. KU-00592-HH TaxID=3127651 RepID=UPI00310791ED